MSDTVLTRSLAARPAVRKTWLGRYGAWLAWLATMLRAVQTRRELAAMDQRLLRDVGLTPHAAMTEAMRAPWDIGTARPPRGRARRHGGSPAGRAKVPG